MQVLDYVYNGFTVNLQKTVASFTAEFSKWTSDPGVMECKCSDGMTRLIPTCALIDFRIQDYPEQNMRTANKVTKKFGIYFGIPSSSLTSHIAS